LPGVSLIARRLAATRASRCHPGVSLIVAFPRLFRARSTPLAVADPANRPTAPPSFDASRFDDRRAYSS